MVIGHDHVDSRPAKFCDWRDRTGAAIASHHDFGAGGDRGAHPSLTEVVAIFDASWNERQSVSAEYPYHARENGSGADPVDIIVAVNEYQLLFPDSACKSLDGFVHRKKRQR